MFQLPFYGYVLGFAHEFLVHATVDLPQDAFWVPALILFILGAAATVDALTEVVPDAIIFLGLVSVTCAQGLYVSWPFASHHILIATLAGLGLWALNQLYRKVLGDYVFHTGDIKWTILAVSCFDILPVFCAWGFALSLGSIKAMFHRMFAHHPLTSLYLAPFLFPGLVAALYVLRVSLHSKDVVTQALTTPFL